MFNSEFLNNLTLTDKSEDMSSRDSKSIPMGNVMMGQFLKSSWR